MSVTKKLKWKRALSRLRFCYDELEYTQESAKAAAPEFEAFYRKFCKENNIDIVALDRNNKQKIDKLYGRNEITDGNASQHSDIDSPGDATIVVHDKNSLQDNEEYEMTSDDIAMHDAFSKLFKQIALKLHPDRIDKSIPDDEFKLRVNMFQKANQSFKDKKYYFLIDLADKYDISTPKNYDLQTRWMKRESESMVMLVDKEKKTYNYGFAEAETQAEKEQLIKNFIFQLFGIIA